MLRRAEQQPSSAQPSPLPGSPTAGLIADSSSPPASTAPLLSSQLPSSHPPRLPRCSLRLVFVVCTIVQVSVACVCVWYIGYASQLSTVSTLSGQLRNQTVAHMIDQISSELSGPILAVNEVDLNTQQRMLSIGWGSTGDPYAALDWSTDVSYYTALANIIRHYPGVTATAMQTSTSVLLTAGLLFNDTDANASPPQLGFLNQDVQSGWRWLYWKSSYLQTLSRMSLLNDIDLLATTANWFDILPTDDLANGRAHPLYSFGYVDPTINNWWVVGMQTADRAIADNNTNVINVGWSIPVYGVNHNTASVTETLSICKPHINTQPNVTWMWEMAYAANATGCPRAPFLLHQAAAQQSRIDSGQPAFPVVDWVSDVTFDPYALVVFMTSRLPSFVLDNGAAFICTTDGWILASTLPGPDLSVLVFMPELLFPNTSELASYSANITAAHPAAMQFLWSLYNNMQSAAWQANINSLSLSDAATPYQLGWEQSERINGAECYVQYAVLGVPASSFSFVLVVYSRQSDYQGGLLHNATLSGVLSAVVILVSILATLLLTQCVNRPILTLISAMKAVLGDNPWQKNPAAATAVAKAWKSKGSHRASFAESANNAANGQHASSIQSEGKPAVDDSPDPQSPSSPGTDQLTPLPVALPSPSRLDHVQKSGDMTLLDHDFLRTSSCSTMPDSINAAVSPHASTVTRTLGQAADGTSPSIPNKSIGQWQPIEAQPAVYAKYVPPTDTSHPNKPGSSNTQADKAASMTIVNPPQSAATSTVVHYPTCISTDEPSKANRQSRSQLDDSSSYELDLLLQKWQRTMLAQGVRLPPEWETDLQEDAQRLRELRMGLREARKRYQGKRRHARAQQDEHGASTAAGSDNEDDDDDRSVFTPNDGRLSAFTKLAMYLRSRTRRVDGDPSNASKHFEHSTSHTSISSNSTSSNHSSHPVGCSCSACQLHRFTNRLFGCAGNFSEVVQLQLTFGAMLFRLRNSALKLEQANQSKRLFLRFVFHEVRVPLNALGLGVEQLYEIGIGEREKREMHATHLQKQQAVLGRMEDELHSSTGSMQTLSALMMQLDQLLFDCPLCAPSTMTAPHHPSHLSSSLLMPNDSSPASTSSTDATSLALLHIVQDQVATVTRILNDVLSFQRIEDGELKLEMAPFNVCVMVDNTLHSFQAEFRQKQLQVKTEYRHYGREREQTMAGTTRGAQQQQQQQQQQQREEEGVKSTDIRVDIASRETSAENGLAGMEGVELQHIRHAAAPSSALSWHVSGDQYRLRQVLSNFVSNAVKFSRQGGSITVLATLTPALTSPASTAAPATTPPSGAHHPTAHFLELAVRDSGIGISPSGLRSLFQPYSQIRPGALQEGKGSGLGLSICKKLVELHGGRVVVSSTPGEGSTFSLGVPVEVMREAEVKEMLRQQAGSSQSREPLAKDEETEEGEEAEQDEEESKQLEGMDAEALEDGLYKYRPKGTEEAPLTVTVPHITPRTDTPSAGVEATQRPDSEPPSFAASSPFALTPNTVRELVMDANTASLPLPQSATATAAINLSHSVRLPTRRLAPTAVASNRPASPNTPPGLGSAADSRRRVQSSDRKLGEERLRALVVEDSAVNRKLLVMMIEKMGLAVESAEDGQYAYELVANYITEQHAANTTDGSGSAGACSSTRSAASADRSTAVTCQYDVIFMDDHMPRCTGVECVAQLRALGVTIPIFGITANALLEDQQRFVAAGVTAVITKPMQKKQLVDMIATVRRIKDEQRKINKQQQMGRDATKQ